MPQPATVFDRTLLRQRRRRVADHAREHDFLLRRVSEDIAGRLSIIQRTFPIAVNLGSGLGLVSAAARDLPNVGAVIDVDTIDLMPCAGQEGPRAAVIADEEALPFGDASLDLVVSGLSLQLVNDLPGTLVQVCRALKPDGLLLASLLGGDTLWQLRQSWMQAEDELTGGVSPRVAPTADVRQLGGLLQRAGFALPVADSDVVTVTYANPLALMADIKAMGASNMLNERRRVPVTRGLLRRAAEIYTERFALPDGRIPATFEIVTLTAWVPDASQQKPLKPGSATMRLADVLGVPEVKTNDKAAPGGGGSDPGTPTS